MTVSDITLKAEGLGGLYKTLGRISAKTGKNYATNVLKNPGRALGITSNNATADATEVPKAALSLLPEVIRFYHNWVYNYVTLYNLCYMKGTKK